jgi:hypothetical protein
MSAKLKWIDAKPNGITVLRRRHGDTLAFLDQLRQMERRQPDPFEQDRLRERIKEMEIEAGILEGQIAECEGGL